MSTGSAVIEVPRSPSAAQGAPLPALRIPDTRQRAERAVEPQSPTVVVAPVAEDMTYGCVDWYYYEEMTPGQCAPLT